ncbi:hypothetical protein ACIGW4_16240 [Streptomyces sp. NPDC053513]|uniref:hypothetical protein n=1 Tax=unclassified Streptomyces TaxID=2593676 RepID=UPI0037CFFFC8
MRTRGRCSRCNTDRLLPGRHTDGTPICRDCASIVRDFFCDRCGFEGLLLGGRLCEHCTLTDTLARLLNDGTGRVAPELLPLVKILLEMDRPKSRLIWLRNPNVVRILQGLATRRPSQSFLRWCMKTDRMPRLALPQAVITQDSEPLHQHRRLAMLRRVLNDDSLPLRARVAAALVLLYAQPVSRIVRLTTDDLTDDETTVTVRLGDPPSPLPEPAADLKRAYIQSRQHLPYASSRSAQWLFPGHQPGQPMNPVSLQVHLRKIGVPPQRGRASAIRQLVLQAPAPVIAKALGYHDKAATRLVTEAGGTWSRYAPGDHRR